MTQVLRGDVSYITLMLGSHCWHGRAAHAVTLGLGV